MSSSRQYEHPNIMVRRMTQEISQAAASRRRFVKARRSARPALLPRVALLSVLQAVFCGIIHCVGVLSDHRLDWCQGLELEALEFEAAAPRRA